MTTILTKDVSIPYNYVVWGFSGRNDDFTEHFETLELKAGEEFYFWKNSDTEISWGEYKEFTGEVNADFWNSIEHI